MQTTHFARLCVRIMALLLLFLGLSSLPESVLVWHDYTIDLYLSAWVLLFTLVNLTPLIAGALFWWRSDQIGRWLDRVSGQPANSVFVSTRQLFCVGWCVGGATLFLSSLGDVASHVFALLLAEPHSHEWRPVFITRLIISGSESVIGLLLFVCAPLMARWCMRWWPLEETR